MEIYQKIVETIVDSKGLDASAIKPESSFKDLSIDSLDIAEMVMNLEDALGTTIELEEGITTVQDLVNLINDRTAGK